MESHCNGGTSCFHFQGRRRRQQISSKIQYQYTASHRRHSSPWNSLSHRNWNNGWGENITLGKKSLSYGHNVHHKIECTKYVCIHVLIWNWAWAFNMGNGNKNPNCERRFDKVINGHSQPHFFSQTNSFFFPERVTSFWGLYHCLERSVAITYFRTAISTLDAASQRTAQLWRYITACCSFLPIMHALHRQCDQSVAYACMS